MSYEAVLRYARDQANVQVNRLTLGASQVQFFPFDPMRFALILTQSANNIIQWTLGVQPNAVPTVGLTAGAGTLVLTEDLVGDLVTLPVWASISAGTPVVCCTAVSYLPERKVILDEFVRKYISQFLAS